MIPREVIVVGGGHAGCEAAVAAARMGCRVAMVTLSRETVGEMPCNPAVGGVGKGHLVAEIDALGGLQGWVTDRAGLQFRVLNRSRGPAVWGPRVQCDKARYSAEMLRLVESVDGLEVVEGEVEGVLVGDAGVEGVRLRGGARLGGRAVVLTTGTFLGGELHTGEERTGGGRFGEGASSDLAAELRRLGVRTVRYKTGTPPRLHRNSLDYGEMAPQEGDAEPRGFSWRREEVRNRCRCWVTRTPEEVRRIIEDNLGRSPLFSGRIEGVGPRYCPSIEDKVVRFPHHREHTVFVEPEGVESPLMYVNGLSTSLPKDVQRAVVRAVPGLRRAEFLRYGYAVEYDVVASLQVTSSLEAKAVGGLFFAGQLLGTSGYEEAAAQGLVAGVSAARAVRGLDGFVIGREEGYIGVLIDDLVRLEHREPYRMFTSRAEHRLVLGVDSARERLMERGVQLGLVPEDVFHVEQARWLRRRRAGEAVRGMHLNPDAETREMVLSLAGVELRGPTTWAQILRRADVDARAVAGELEVLRCLSPRERELVVALLRYDGYVERSERERARVARLRGVTIPRDLDLEGTPGLSREAREGLARELPRTLAEAERVSGVTPAALALLAGRLSAAGRAVE